MDIFTVEDVQLIFTEHYLNTLMIFGKKKKINKCIILTHTMNPWIIYGHAKNLNLKFFSPPAWINKSPPQQHLHASDLRLLFISLFWRILLSDMFNALYTFYSFHYIIFILHLKKNNNIYFLSIKNSRSQNHFCKKPFKSNVKKNETRNLNLALSSLQILCAN